MTEPLVVLDSVTIRYPDLVTFSNISFTVRQGEHWALLGNNETLKTALLEAAAGKISIISGCAAFPFFDDYKTHHSLDPLLSPRKLVAYIAARHAFKDLSNTSQFYYQQRFNSVDSENSKTVRQYLSTITPRTATGWGISEVIERLRLQPLVDEELIKLSNGETKRVLIASALLRHPLLLLLNNPLTGLDVQSRKDITELIDKVAGLGVTIIMSASTTELPDAITHVAVANENGTITTCKRSEYIAPRSERPAAVVVDDTEIARLLSISKMPKFEQVVHMKDVSIKYGGKLILDRINWTVKQGERWALVGHNGAGKSTLLSLINGDNPQAFANHIILFDRKKGSGESIWDIKKKIGFFSAELYQYFPLETSCRQAVESGFYNTIGLFRPSRPQTASISARWMKLLGVDQLSNKLLKNVSATEQRLVLLARAFVKSPVLLILDEPTQGFNDQQRSHFKALLNTICRHSNLTLIYVSHYAEDIPETVTKVIELKAGKRTL